MIELNIQVFLKCYEYLFLIHATAMLQLPVRETFESLKSFKGTQIIHETILFFVYGHLESTPKSPSILAFTPIVR